MPPLVQKIPLPLVSRPSQVEDLRKARLFSSLHDLPPLEVRVNLATLEALQGALIYCVAQLHQVQYVYRCLVVVVNGGRSGNSLALRRSAVDTS
jgi:hypothetical protein